MKKYSRIFALILSWVFVIVLFTGCGQTTTNNASATSQVSTAVVTTQEASTQSEASTASTLPITPEKTTFKIWWPYGFQQWVPSLADTDGNIELEKRTNIHLERNEPPAGQEAESFKLMISSNDYPDIIYNAESTTYSYPGGSEKAVQDGVYLKLNDLVAKNAPNYNKLLEDATLKKLSVTDNGTMWCMYSISTYSPSWTPMLEKTGQGIAIRKDWLDELGLQLPVTIDDWHTVLKAFKEKKKCESPLLLYKDGVPNFSEFITAFGTAFSTMPGKEFYQVDGKVKFGPLEPGYKEYLTTMNAWYKEGLIDKNFASRNDPQFPNNLLAADKGGASAMGWGYTGDALYAQTKATKNEKFNLAAVEAPVLKAGDISRSTLKANPVMFSTVITSACKNPDIAVRFLDYLYGREGALLNNYGVEGKSYTIDSNGNIAYTDYVMKNDKLAPPFMAIKASSVWGPGLQDLGRMLKFSSPKQQAAYDVWDKVNKDWAMPLITQSSQEGEELSSIMTDINTYVVENTVKFIMGVQPMSGYEDFVKQIQSMNINKAIEIKQAALDRFNKR